MHGGAVEYRPVTIVDAGERKALELRIEVPVEDMARLGEPGDRAPGSAPREPARTSIWSAIHPRLLDLVREHRSTLDLRQQPAPRGAAGRRAQRAGRRAAGPGPPRLPGARAARGDRGPAQGRGAPRPRGHLVARAGHRHGRHRPGHPDRGPAVGGQRTAAHRPGRAPRRCGEPRHRLPEVPGRSRGVRRRHPPHARRPGGGHALSPQSARRPRPADRGHGGHGALARRRPPRHRAARGALRGAEPARLRERAGHAVRPLSLGRVRRAAPAPHLGPRGRDAHHARGRAPRGDRQRGDHSRSRALRGLPRRGGAPGARRRAGRGDGLREPRGRDVPARRLHVAHRGDHPRPGPRLPGPGPARQDALLARRRPGPPPRAGPAHRAADPRAARDAGRGGAPPPRAPARSRRGGGDQPAPVSPRSGRRGRGAGRSHGGHRALPRRAG